MSTTLIVWNWNSVNIFRFSTNGGLSRSVADPFFPSQIAGRRFHFIFNPLWGGRTLCVVIGLIVSTMTTCWWQTRNIGGRRLADLTWPCSQMPARSFLGDLNGISMTWNLQSVLGCGSTHSTMFFCGSMWALVTRDSSFGSNSTTFLKTIRSGLRSRGPFSKGVAHRDNVVA